MSPTIRIDGEVYEGLKARAEPFVDTPNSVLRRLLGLVAVRDANDGFAAEGLDPSSGRGRTGDPTRGDGPKPETAGIKLVKQAEGARRKRSKQLRVRSRVPAGSLLPEGEYDLPLLEALIDLGGSAPSRDVIERVGEKLRDRLTDLDRQELSSGGLRWQNRTQFARLRMVQRDLMEKNAGRGIWAITEKGRKQFTVKPSETV